MSFFSIVRKLVGCLWPKCRCKWMQNNELWLIIQLSCVILLMRNIHEFKLSTHDFQGFAIKNIKLENRTGNISSHARQMYLLVTRFTRIHERAFEEDNISQREPKRIVFNGHTTAGYANKIYALITAFTIALLTDSAFICEWRGIGEHIESPFKLSFHKFLQENELNSNFRPEQVYVFGRSTNAFMTNKSLQLIVNQTIPTNYTRFVYKYYEPYIFELCSNPIYYDKLLSYELVSRESINRARLLFNNSTYNHASITLRNDDNTNELEKQQILFSIGYEVAGAILNAIWTPKAHIRRKMAEYDFYFSKYFIIGLQIRSEFISDPVNVNRFFRCALNIEANLTSQQKRNGVKWYVSSDSSSVIDRAIQTYGRNKVISGTGRIAHIEWTSGGYERAILDNELLSRCDDIITTGGSTFGFVAAMKSRRFPKVLYLRGKHLPDEECQTFTFINDYRFPVI